MAPRLGVVGRGYWGNTYAKVLDQLGIEYWQAGKDWHFKPRPHGLIVASSSCSHYEVARRAMSDRIPVLIEKPVCHYAFLVRNLIDLGGIALAGHTRLHDPAWGPFKESVGVVESVEAFAGGANVTNPDPEWNWWNHLVPMCLDIGFDPERAIFHITKEKQPLRFIANGKEFRDTAGGLAALVREFVQMIEKGEPDNRLEIGLRSIEFCERRRPWVHTHTSMRSTVAP